MASFFRIFFFELKKIYFFLSVPVSSTVGGEVGGLAEGLVALDTSESHNILLLCVQEVVAHFI